MSKFDVDLLAGRVSDGARIDWDLAEKSAGTDEERRIVRNLRLVESLAAVHANQEIDSSDQDTHPATDDASQPATVDVERDESPRELARWGSLELRERLGEGAFGEVFRAWDANLDRDVALKLMKPGALRDGSLASTVLNEGRLLARVEHPNVVTVYGAETHDGRVGLWMELVRGRSLADFLKDQGKMGAREAMLIGLDLCRALAAVHAAGLVHRDIKAQNVMRQEGGRILLMDFGAVRDLNDLGSWRDKSITGTPFYIAPEIFCGEIATGRSDIYSLGVLLYHLVSQTFPVQARTLSELREAHGRGESKLLRDVRPDLPEPFVNLVQRAIAANPDERYATAGEMEQALSACLGVPSEVPRAQEPARKPRAMGRHRWLSAALAAAAVLVLALVGYAMFSRSAPSGAAAEYTIEASLFRVGAGDERERLDSGARLAIGDRLTLELEASRAVYLYVINRDRQGRAFALFPLPDLDLQNPVPAGRTNQVPGSRNGKTIYWEVSSTGGREDLLILASPERQIEFEAEMIALARPGQPAVALPDLGEVRLRGIGGLAEGAAAEGSAPDSAARLFDMAEEIGGRRPEQVEGVWFRKIELVNPAPKAP